MASTTGRDEDEAERRQREQCQEDAEQQGNLRHVVKIHEFEGNASGFGVLVEEAVGAPELSNQAVENRGRWQRAGLLDDLRSMQGGRFLISVVGESQRN